MILTKPEEQKRLTKEEFDQFLKENQRASLESSAKTLFDHYRAYMNVGFSKDQAFALVMEMIRINKK